MSHVSHAIHTVHSIYASHASQVSQVSHVSVPWDMLNPQSSTFNVNGLLIFTKPVSSSPLQYKMMKNLHAFHKFNFILLYASELENYHKNGATKNKLRPNKR